MTYDKMTSQVGYLIDQVRTLRSENQQLRDRLVQLEGAGFELCVCISNGFPDYGRIDQLARRLSILLVAPVTPSTRPDEHVDDSPERKHEDPE